MFGFSNNPKKLRILVLCDVDCNSASKLAEYFIPKPPQFDCCVVCGPFTQTEIENRELEAKAEGDVASVIAQLENIVCRVIYVPSDRE